MDILPDAVIAHCNGKIVFCNIVAARLFGVSSTADLIGLDADLLIHETDRQSLDRRRQEVEDEPDFLEFETRQFARLNGEQFSAKRLLHCGRWKMTNYILLLYVT